MKSRVLLLPLACALTVMPHSSEAAPIQLQATSVSEGNTNCNTYTVSGANFSFSSNIFGFCSGPGIYGTPGGSLSSYVAIYAPPYPTNTPGEGQTLGGINIPENPGRVAFFTGLVSSSGPSVTIPASALGPVQLETMATLQGTLNACLLPAAAVGGGPCDPSYANFATVTFNLTGVDTFTGSCLDAYTCFFSENFTTSAASAPEPATLGTVGLAALSVLTSLYFKKKSPDKGRTLYEAAAQDEIALQPIWKRPLPIRLRTGKAR